MGVYPQAVDRVDALLAAWRAEQPEMATLNLEIVKRTGRLAALVDVATQRALSGFDITYAEFDVLATLRRAGKPYRLKPGRLARESMLTTGGTANILQRLTAAGLVEREPDPDDRRSSWVRLTRDGARTATAVAKATSAAYADLLGGVPEETLDALNAALRATLIALDDGPP